MWRGQVDSKSACELVGLGSIPESPSCYTLVEEIQNMLYILVRLLKNLGEDSILFCFLNVYQIRILW